MATARAQTSCRPLGRPTRRGARACARRSRPARARSRPRTRAEPAASANGCTALAPSATASRNAGSSCMTSTSSFAATLQKSWSSPPPDLRPNLPGRSTDKGTRLRQHRAPASRRSIDPRRELETSSADSGTERRCGVGSPYSKHHPRGLAARPALAPCIRELPLTPSAMLVRTRGREAGNRWLDD